MHYLLVNSLTLSRNSCKSSVLGGTKFGVCRTGTVEANRWGTGAIRILGIEVVLALGIA